MEKKTTGETKKNISFSIAVIGLAIVVIAPIVLFVFSALFHGKSTGEFTKAVYPVKYEYYVEKYSKEFDVDVCLIYGIIRTESGFDPDAVSQAGAIGLMQLMPDTFTWLQNYRTEFMPDKIIDSKELYKPGVNIEYGTYMLKFLLDHYNGNRSLAIIAYNEPITRIQIDEIRGINSSQMVRNLIAKGLIENSGKSDLPGRPNLYKTTDFFLDYFGINSLNQLPQIELPDSDDTETNLFESKYKEN